MCDTLRNTGQPRPLGRPRHPLADAELDPLAAIFFGLDLHIFKDQLRSQSSQLRPIRPRLPGLLLQHFTGVADALLLIRIRLAQPPHVGGDLADQLPVDAGHGDVRLLVDRDVDARPGRRTRSDASSRARARPACPSSRRDSRRRRCRARFFQPSVTPSTALLTRLRARPWNLSSSRSSDAFLVTSWPSSTAAVTPGGSACASGPSAP